MSNLDFDVRCINADPQAGVCNALTQAGLLTSPVYASAFLGTPPGSIAIPGSGAFVRVLFNSVISDAAGIYNPATGEFTIPRDGTYVIQGKVTYFPLVPAADNAAVSWSLFPRIGVNFPTNFSNFSTPAAIPIGITQVPVEWTVDLSAGDVVVLDATATIAGAAFTSAAILGSGGTVNGGTYLTIRQVA